MRATLSATAILLLLLVPAAAEDEHHGAGGNDDHATSGHHDFRHELALFVGATDKKGHDSELTLGLEYAHSLTPKLALGGILEHVGGELRNTILAVPLYGNPSAVSSSWPGRASNVTTAAAEVTGTTHSRPATAQTRMRPTSSSGSGWPIASTSEIGTASYLRWTSTSSTARRFGSGAWRSA